MSSSLASPCRFKEPRPLESMRDFVRSGSACKEAKDKELDTGERLILYSITGGGGAFTLSFDLSKNYDEEHRGVVTEEFEYREPSIDGKGLVTRYTTDTKWYESIMYGEPDTIKGINRVLSKECTIVDKNYARTNIHVRPRNRKTPITIKKVLYDEELLKCKHGDTKYWALRIFSNKYDSTGRLVGGNVYIWISAKRPPFRKEIKLDVENFQKFKESFMYSVST